MQFDTLYFHDVELEYNELIYGLSSNNIIVATGSYGSIVDWKNDAYRTITISSKLSEVTNGSILLNYLNTSAIKQSDFEPDTPTDAVTIKYKDTTIPVEAGQTVTLNTTGKKFTEDIEVTAPKESGGGGVKKYNISWDFSQVKSKSYYGIFAAPQTICEGGTVYAVFACSFSPYEVVCTGANASISDHSLSSYVKVNNLEDYKAITSSPAGYCNGYLYRVTVSNPTDDVSIVLKAVAGGAN